MKKIKDKYSSGAGGVRLTDWQELILGEEIACGLAKSGESTHGLVRVDGEICYQGRCEYTPCSEFSTCKETAKFERVTVVSTETTEEKRPALTCEWLGFENIDEIFFKKSTDEEDKGQVEIVPEESVIRDFKEFARPEEFTGITNPAAIVEAPINSKILVNAAPGSGKTYAVIKRLEHIVDKELIDNFSSILVLVYTNAAKNEILTRLRLGVEQGFLPYAAMNIDVCTFDSLATSYLSTIESESGFERLDYNGRIRLFNEKFDVQDFSNFEFVIIDELQDLVNERAVMTLNILSALTGGYLLLGDKCQAIYDYDCHEGKSLNSVEFYEKLDAFLHKEVLKYEFVGNQRQIPSLAGRSNNMRCSLLDLDNPTSINDSIKKELDNINVSGDVEAFDFSNLTKKTAILCRTNGEAEYISHILHNKNVRHSLLRSAGEVPTLNRWIAECFWDYQADSRMSEKTFIERYRGRVLDCEDKAVQCYEALCDLLYDEKKHFIEIEKLSIALIHFTAGISSLLLNSDEPLLTVSTIHKAKGREFDCVYLLDSGFSPNDNDTEEARVWYVGCTRAKMDLNRLKKKKNCLKASKVNKMRWMDLGFYRASWGETKRYCRNIVVGLSKDVFAAGFVAGDLDEAVALQEYIAKSVSVGDECQLILDGSVYRIQHKDKTIGVLNPKLRAEFLNIARENFKDSSPPSYLSPIFVKNIITVTPNCFHENVSAYFRTTKFWLGVELSGFPRVDWKYEDK